jgi:hypothetical protein
VSTVPLERVAGITNVLRPDEEVVRSARLVGISFCD